MYIHAYLLVDIEPALCNNPEAVHASNHRTPSLNVSRQPLTRSAGSHEVQTCALMPAVDFVQNQEKLDKGRPRNIQRRAPQPSVRMTIEAQSPISIYTEGSSIGGVASRKKRQDTATLISHLSKATIIEERLGSGRG